MMKEVTIAIPVYQVEDFIEESLLSALGQSFPSIEFLIVDDCGIDRSIEIVNKIASTHPRGKEIRIISHETNQGIATVRNTAILNTRTKYLFFLDSDDSITPNCIELLYKCAEKHQTDFVTSAHQKIELNGHTALFSNKETHNIGNENIAKQYFRHNNYEYISTNMWNKLYRTDFLQKNRILCIPHTVPEEPAFIFQLVLYTTNYYALPNITYIYKLRPMSITQQGARLIPKKEIQSHIASLNYKKEYLPNLKNKTFYPDVVLHIMQNCLSNAAIFVSAKTEEKFSNFDLRSILSIPLHMKDTLTFNHSKFPSLFLYLFFNLPIPIIRFILLAYINPKRYWWKAKRKWRMNR